MALLLLLSPSKTQESGRTHSHHTLPPFLQMTEQLVKQLQLYDTEQLASLMKMSDKLARMNKERFSLFRFPPSEGNCRQALLAFRGDVFSEIEADDYSDDDFEYAQQHLRILSGLYGILRPLDLIQPYRLEMGGKFTMEGKTLTQIWKPRITETLNTQLSILKDGVLLNLASNEYFKAVEHKKVQAAIFSASFKQRKDGKLRTVAIHAKRARGALTNFIIKNRIDNITQLKEFSYGGYHYSEELSGKNEIAFIKGQM